MDINSLYRTVHSSTGYVPHTNPSREPAGASSTTRHASQDIRPGSIVIAVMGVTGSGKSTFIQHFNSEAVVGHSLESCTSDVQVHSCRLPDSRVIYLVDTPGFDDTHLADQEVLRKVATWFSQTYGAGIKMSGVVYLHRIFDTRLTGASMRNLNMFKKLVGRDSLANVVLATTMWDTIPLIEYPKAEARERELKGTESFWKDMIAYGSEVVRHNSGKTSAMNIIQTIISRNRPVALDIQREMVDAGIPLEQTSAGQTVLAEIEKARLEFEERISKLQSDFRASLQRQEQEHQARLSESRAKLQQKVQQNRELAEKLTTQRMQRRQQYRDEADNKIQRMVSSRRAEEASWREAAEKTRRQGYWRHPDCYNHWPDDPWHQSNCGHPLYM